MKSSPFQSFRSRFFSSVPCIMALLLLSVAGGLPAQDGEADPEPAQVMPLADESLLLDMTRSGNRWVVVGSRGHVLWSDDGQQWTQAEQVPARSTLTGVTAADGRLWAAGHDALIISSEDGGANWTLQNFEPGMEPILDILFVDADTGFALGAYGVLLRTDDGGASWEAQDLTEQVTGELFDPEALQPSGDDYAAQFADLGCYEFKECHLNGIVSLSGNRLLMVAEKGFGYRSSDGGETWEVFRLPYDGSMFGVINDGGDCVLAYGLRGHAFRSCDFGSSWQDQELTVQESIIGADHADGRTLLVGNNGLILSREGPRGDYRVLPFEGEALAAVAALDANRLVLVGQDGIQAYPPQQDEAAAEDDA